MRKISNIIVLLFVVLNSSFISATEDNWIKVDDSLTMVAYQKGEGNPTILFVHGWSNDKTIWSETQKFLSDSYRTVAVDLPRFGLSSTTRDDVSVDFYASSVVSVINEFELDSVILVGFSMGAGVVIETATIIPEKIVGIIIVDHFQDIDNQMPDSIFDGFAAMCMDVVTNPTIEKLAPFLKNRKEEFLELYKFKMSEVSKEGWRETLYTYQNWMTSQLKAKLKLISVPVKAINSSFPPTNVEAFQKFIPSFSVKIVENSGHVIMWDQPELFKEALNETINEILQK